MRHWALIIGIAATVGCTFEPGGHVRGDVVADASTGGAPDALAVADAGPACTNDEHCATAPNVCAQAGSCDLEAGVCVFTDVDCGGEDDDCNRGVCDPESGACVKQPTSEGMKCGAETECGVFSDCAYEAGTCDESGTRSQDCTDYKCMAGACAGTLRVVPQDCSRGTEGDNCGATTCGGFSACEGFTDTCDEDAFKLRDCTAYECAGGACTGLGFAQSVRCTRGDRDGTPCGIQFCTVFTACQFSPGNECDDEGVRVRMCTPSNCMDQACITEPAYTDTEDCGRDTSTVVCDTICTGSGEHIDCTPVHCAGGRCPTG